MKLKILGVSVLGLVLASTVFAAEFITPQNHYSPNVATGSNETHKNLYIVGRSVSVDSSTKGDLLALGGMVSIDGSVERDLSFIGGNISLSGPVGANVKFAGGNISLNSPIGADLVGAGGNIIVNKSAPIGGDVALAGGRISIDSNIAGNARIRGGSVEVNGKIKGNLEVVSTNDLTFGPDSEVSGVVTYKGVKEAIVMPGAKVSNIQYTKMENPRSPAHALKGLFAVATLLKLIGMLIAGLLFLWLLPAKTKTVVASTRRNALQHFGIGVLAIIVIPVISVLLMFTVIGFYLACILMMFYMLLLMIAGVFMLFYTGNLVYALYDKKADTRLVRDLILGTILVLILSFVPVLGWIAIAVLLFIVFGSIISKIKNEQLA